MTDNQALTNKIDTIESATYIQSRYQESFNFLQERKRRQVSQLVLLNNLQRGDQNIASTLLLTLFNRILSNLYDDKIQVKFLPSQGVTQEQITAFNTLAQSDYIEMDKAALDYDWAWDTLFFGRGYCETLRFNKKRKIMEPCVINPLMFGYDPYFENPKEWRYYWKWVTKSKVQIQKLIKNGYITGITKPEEIQSGIDPFLWDYKIRRDRAMKAVQPAPDTTNGDVYQILEYFGYDEKGKKCVYWIDRGFSKILMKETLNLKDGEDGDSEWPIVIKESFRLPHASVPFSVADLLEDKHRAKSVLLNLAYLAAKDRANPLYGYNPDKIRDVSQLFNRQISQHIPMESQDAMWPLNTEDPMSAGLIQFISLLTTEANEPVGTGMVMQPITKGKETATEAAITQQLNDMAQSLQSKVMQFGEKEFWSHWFARYKRYGPDLEEKIANIVGVKGITSQTIDLTNFATKYPPGVMVYSAKEAEYKELVLRRDLMTLYPQLATTLDPSGMRNFNKYVFFPKFLQDPSLIDIMLPKTIDELKAENENEIMKDGTMPSVAETDDHTEHLYVHQMMQPKNWAAWTHIAWHEELLAEQKKNEMAQQQMQQTQPPMGAQAPAGQTNPMEAASPLKGAMAKVPGAVIKKVNQQNA